MSDQIVTEKEAERYVERMEEYRELVKRANARKHTD